MAKELFHLLKKEIENLHAAGLFHDEYMTGHQHKAQLDIDGKSFIDMTSTDYLGLAQDPRIVDAAKKAIDDYGPGTGSHRFLAGTGQIHLGLEQTISEFLEKESTALFSSLYQANVGIFESLVNHQDYIFANFNCHPSIFDGIQLSKAKKQYWGFGDLTDLEDQLKRSPRARFRFIFAEGVYSHDGKVADLQGICDLADKYDAIVILHDTSGIGVVGEGARGSAELCGVLERIDIITGSFSKALSGVELGFVAGNQDLVRWLKQKSKPYVFSTSPSPALVASAKEALSIAKEDAERRRGLAERVQHFREDLNGAGFRLVKGEHPIVAVLTNDAVKTQKVVDHLFAQNIFTTGLCYPVVPKGFARVLCQVTVNHTPENLQQVTEALSVIGLRLKIIKKN